MNRSGATLRRLQFVVPHDQISPAAALLETAAGTGCAITNALANGRAPQKLVGVSVYVPEVRSRTIVSRVRRALSGLQHRGILMAAQLQSTTLAEEDWALSWKSFFRPFLIAPGLLVAPSWHSRFNAKPGVRVLRIDPGMAFGTGQHPTTQLVLNALLPRVKRGLTVFDVGCGSGILGIAAAQRGARIYATDNDPIAIAAAKNNFQANHVRCAKLVRSKLIPKDFPRADLIVANITAAVLARLAKSFCSHLLPSGQIIISGFANRSRAQVLEAFGKAGLQLHDELKSGPWLAHVYRRKKSA